MVLRVAAALAALAFLRLQPVAGLIGSSGLCARGIRLERWMSSLVSGLGGDDSEGPIEDAIGAPVGPLPSVSSRINYGSLELNPTVDLWVVGAGTLGGLAVR